MKSLCPHSSLFALLAFGQLLIMSRSVTIAPSAGACFNIFAGDLFDVLATNGQNQQENLVFSPASIHSCLALAFMGAQSTTAHELRKVLRMSHRMLVSDIAERFGAFIAAAFKDTHNSDAVRLKMVNRIYVSEKLEVKSEFNELAEKYFHSMTEKINFTSSFEAAQAINTWVEEQTDQKIKNLIQPDSLNADTSLLLVNAIYFKGLWEQPFSVAVTQLMTFQNTERDTATVNMMYNDGRYRWKDLDELNATALEIPYRGSELSMLILLPKAINGLNELEQKVAMQDLNELLYGMETEAVDLFLPKFRIETELNLKPALEKLGIKFMFTELADFGGLVTAGKNRKVSEVRHKAFLDINEAGSEAVASSFMKLIPMSLNLKQKIFKVDHPFMFAIRSPEAIFFTGHVAKF